MNFKKKRGKGSKLWVAGHYRVTWRNEAHGIQLPPRFFACVRAVGRLSKPEQTLWDFAGARRPFKTFKRAVQECERHEKAWAEIVALGAEQYFIKALEAIRGKYPQQVRAIPVYALRTVRPAILERFSDSCDKSRENFIPLSETSPPSTPQTVESAGPASSAEDVGSLNATTGAVQALNRATSCALPVEGPATPRKKSSKPRTKSGSTATRKKCDSGKSAKRPSPNSPRKRRKR